MKCNYQTPIKEETETFHEEIIEPLELLPEQQIYNPIIDEFPPTNPHYLDFEQYIAVKRVIPKEWSLTGLTNIPIKNNNINNNKLTCETAISHDNNVNTESTCSNLIKTSTSPFWYANRITLPKLPYTVKNNKLTPFQILQQRLQNIKNYIQLKKNNQLNPQCDLKLMNVNHNNKSARNVEEEYQKQIKIKKIRLKRIGSYSTLYYNKLELKKVEQMRHKLGLVDNTFKSGLIKLTKKNIKFNNNGNKNVISNYIRRKSFNYERGFTPIQLNVVKIGNVNNSCRNEKSVKHFNYNWNNISVSRNSKEFESHLSGFHSVSSVSVFNNKNNNNNSKMNCSNTSQTQNDLSNKSEFELKGNKRYL